MHDLDGNWGKELDAKTRRGRLPEMAVFRTKVLLNPDPIQIRISIQNNAFYERNLKTATYF